MTDREKAIAIIDNDILIKSDAIVLLEGDGFHRYLKAVTLYKEGWAKKIIFSGGIADYEYGSYPFSDILPKLLSEGVDEIDIIHESVSKNTYEQAVEVINLAIKYDWSKLILVASHEHQYRAYLTFLKQVLDTKRDIILFNSPARNLGWFNDSGWGLRYERLEKEFERIEKYSELGHLADFCDVIRYQEWKEKQVWKLQKK